MAFLTYKFAICYRFKTHLPAWLDGSCHEAAWLKWVSGRARSHVHGVGIACCVCILLEESHRLQKKIMLHLFGGKKLGKNYRTGLLGGTPRNHYSLGTPFNRETFRN